MKKIVYCILAVIGVALLFAGCSKAAPDEMKNPTIDPPVNEDGLQIWDGTLIEDSIRNLNQTISIHDHDAIDLGLPSGTLWASCNIGAASITDQGDFFAWGETESKEEFTQENYKFYLPEDDEHRGYTKYVTDSLATYCDQKTQLEEIDDAAHVLWGAGWHMPSLEQTQELLNHCVFQAGILHGMRGYRIVGPNKQCIFLPYSTFFGAAEEIYTGEYWTASLHPFQSDWFAAVLLFDTSAARYGWDRNPRYIPSLIRPVYTQNN